MVELEIYAMGEPTGAKIKIDPAFVAGVEELPGKPRASKVVFMAEPSAFVWATLMRSAQSSARSDVLCHL